MSDLFLSIVNMSISASWIVLAVLVLRFVLKKAPKWISVLRKRAYLPFFLMLMQTGRTSQPDL